MFGFRKKVSIDEKYKECRKKNGILLDVRTKEEFQEGHLPGAVNIPLSDMEEIETQYPEKDRHYYVYCHSGKRAEQAVSLMKSLGFANCENIGGMLDYTDEVEK